MDLKKLNEIYGDDADFQKFLRLVLKKKFEKEIMLFLEFYGSNLKKEVK